MYLRIIIALICYYFMYLEVLNKNKIKTFSSTSTLVLNELSTATSTLSAGVIRMIARSKFVIEIGKLKIAVSQYVNEISSKF